MLIELYQESLRSSQGWDDNAVSEGGSQNSSKRRSTTTTSSNSSSRATALKLPANAWDDFYTAHGERFFKDRHYLEYEHKTLADRLMSSTADTVVRILDLGCGVGNSILPLLEKTTCKVEYLGVDVSPKAIEILNEKLKNYGDRHFGFVRVLDVVNCTQEEWDSVLRSFYKESNSAVGFDFCLMVFSVSAFPPERMATSVKRACDVLKPGSGIVCFRDYLRGDLAEERFPPGQKLGRNLFVRQDGTLSFFFTVAGLITLFEACGFMKTLWTKKVIRTVENRAYELKMNRSWVGAEFVRMDI